MNFGGRRRRGGGGGGGSGVHGHRRGGGGAQKYSRRSRRGNRRSHREEEQMEAEDSYVSSLPSVQTIHEPQEQVNSHHSNAMSQTQGDEMWPSLRRNYQDGPFSREDLFPGVNYDAIPIQDDPPKVTQVASDHSCASSAGHQQETTTTNRFKLSRHEATSMTIEALHSTRQMLRESLRILEEEETDRALCVVCLEKHRAALFLPCRHMVSCEVCYLVLLDCPVCRKRITHKIPVFN